MKNNTKYIVFGILFFFSISFIFSNANQNTELKATDIEKRGN